jgi:hypothetical protein
MGSIKQKENINKNPDDEFFIMPVWKTRTQELADRMRQREFPGSDDILPMLEKVGGTLVKSEEYLPGAGKETMSNEESDKERE